MMKKSYYKKKAKIEFSGGKHIPNKKEAKEIRKAKSQTGKTEDELREDKYYRELFSDAAKVNKYGFLENVDRKYVKICRMVRRKTGFRNSHPDSVKELEDCLKYYNPRMLSADNIIKIYGK